MLGKLKAGTNQQYKVKISHAELVGQMIEGMFTGLTFTDSPEAVRYHILLYLALMINKPQPLLD